MNSARMDQTLGQYETAGEVVRKLVERGLVGNRRTTYNRVVQAWPGGEMQTVHEEERTTLDRIFSSVSMSMDQPPAFFPSAGMKSV